jgi:selenide, water dikinase
MMTLNKAGAEAASAVGAHAATDITGFGFLGHATEMAEAAGITLRVAFERVPFIEGAHRYASEWRFPGGSAANKLAYEAGVRFEGDLPEESQMLLFDAQTSGGLLIALPAGARDAFAAHMAESGGAWWEIGSVEERGDASIIVTA